MSSILTQLLNPHTSPNQIQIVLLVLGLAGAAIATSFKHHHYGGSPYYGNSYYPYGGYNNFGGYGNGYGNGYGYGYGGYDKGYGNSYY